MIELELEMPLGKALIEYNGCSLGQGWANHILHYIANFS